MLYPISVLRPTGFPFYETHSFQCLGFELVVLQQQQQAPIRCVNLFCDLANRYRDTNLNLKTKYTDKNRDRIFVRLFCLGINKK